MEVSIPSEESKKEGKLVVFSDIEYKICDGFTARVRRRLSQLRGESWKSERERGRLILRGLCGVLRPARLTFILGPSGAGKSSLLHILTGRRREGVLGEVSGGGRAVLVAQQATFLCVLTVGEVLCFAVSLKLPHAAPTEKTQAVDRVCRLVGLENVTSTRTSRLSGGERKRLSVACELLTDPPVLLLDEPTSGLDSVSSMSVVRALGSVARSGRTVACVLHQPSSRLYAMADDLMLLAGGRALYAGPRDLVPAALARAGFEFPTFYNPADYLLEVATGEHAGDLSRLELEARNYSYQFRRQAQPYRLPNGVDTPLLNGNTHINGKSLMSNGTQKITICKMGGACARSYAASAGAQVRALLRRSLSAGARDAHLARLRLGAHALVALLLGALFVGAGADAARVTTNASCLFFFLLFLFFSNAMPTIHTFPCEAEVVIQEHLNFWYSLPSYWISKLLADIPLQVLCATVFVVPAWLLTGQPTDDYSRLALMWLLCVLLTVLAQTMGLCIGAACDVKAGLFLVPALNIPMLMFSGFFIPYAEMPVYLRPLAWISYFRYAFDAAMQCVYGFSRQTLPCSTPFCFFRYPEKFLKDMSLPNDYWGSISIIIAWIVVLQATVLLVLLFRVRRACK